MVNLDSMTMARTGKMVFTRNLDQRFLVTQDDLDTGHIAAAEFSCSGQIRCSFRRRACNMGPVYLEYCSAYRPLEYVIEQGVGGNSLMNSEYVASRGIDSHIMQWLTRRIVWI
jgi:hypothetical protein